MKDEIDRRASYTRAVLDLFLAHPFEWLDVRSLAQVGGFAAWRTRVSDARHIIHDRCSGTIEWNGLVKESAYRYVPVVVKKDAKAQQMGLGL